MFKINANRFKLMLQNTIYLCVCVCGNTIEWFGKV